MPRSHSARPLCFESLQKREMMAADAGFAMEIQDGNLVIEGTQLDDQVFVQQSGDTFQVTAVNENGSVTQEFSGDQFDEILFRGGEGDDRLYILERKDGGKTEDPVDTDPENDDSGCSGGFYDPSHCPWSESESSDSESSESETGETDCENQPYDPSHCPWENSDSQREPNESDRLSAKDIDRFFEVELGDLESFDLTRWYGQCEFEPCGDDASEECSSEMLRCELDTSCYTELRYFALDDYDDWDYDYDSSDASCPTCESDSPE